MFNSVDMGLMVVKSAAFRRKSAQESAAADHRRSSRWLHNTMDLSRLLKWHEARSG